MNCGAAILAAALASVVVAGMPATAQTAATPPAAPPIPPAEIPSAAARDPQSGRHAAVPGTPGGGAPADTKPKPATDPPGIAPR